MHQVFVEIFIPGIAKPEATLLAFLKSDSLSLSSAGFIGHKLVESDLFRAFILPHQASSVQTATCYNFQRRLHTDTLDLNTTRVLRPLQEAGANTFSKYRWIKLSNGVSPQWRFYRRLDIQKLWIVLFYDDEEVAFAALFVFEQGFWKSNRICANFEDGNGRR